MALAEETARTLYNILHFHKKNLLNNANSICKTVHLFLRGNGAFTLIAPKAQALVDSGPGILKSNDVAIAKEIAMLLDKIYSSKKVMETATKAIYGILKRQEQHLTSIHTANSIHSAILPLCQEKWEDDVNIAPIAEIVQHLADFGLGHPLTTDHLNIVQWVARLLNMVQLSNVPLFNKMREMEKGLGFPGVEHSELQIGVLIALDPQFWA